MLNDALYSLDPRERWAAACSVRAEEGQALRQRMREDFPTWPRYWWGVANAWLAYVGPSPGNSRANEIDWDRERWPTLGEPHEHFVSQDDSTGFWRRLREWTVNAYSLAGVFVDRADAAIGSTLLANLLDTREGDAGKIGDHDLMRAVPAAVALLGRVRPRVIVPMEKRVAQLLVQGFVGAGARIVAGPSKASVPALHQRYPFYRPSTWQLQAPFGPLTIAESPQHPSKRNFYDPTVMDRYLADKIDACLR